MTYPGTVSPLSFGPLPDAEDDADEPVRLAALEAVATLTFTGDDGYNIAELDRARDEFEIARIAGGFTLTAPDLVVELFDMEEVAFTDTSLFLEPVVALSPHLTQPALRAYDPSQDKGYTKVLEGGAMKLGGNEWTALEVNKTITADTVLRFSARSEFDPELVMIGFDTDLSLTLANLFTIGGTDGQVTPWVGHVDYVEQAVDATGAVYYEIPVGAFFTGDFKYMVFANDDDAWQPGDDPFSFTIFDDIELFERRTFVFDDTEMRLSGYGQGGEGGAEVSADGLSLTLEAGAAVAVTEFTRIAAPKWMTYTVEGEIDPLDPLPRLVFDLDPNEDENAGEVTLAPGAAADGKREYIFRLSDAIGFVDYRHIAFINDGPSTITLSNVDFIYEDPVVLGDDDWAPSDYTPNGDAAAAPGGDGLLVSGDAWLELGETRTVGAGTWLVFDYDVDIPVDDVRVGIGLGAAGTQFDIYGAMIDAVSPAGNPLTGYSYVSGYGTARIFVDLGTGHAGEAFDRLNISVDPQAGTPEVEISNVVFYDTMLMVAGRPTELVSYDGKQDKIAAELLPDGSGFTLIGNSWKAMEVNATVTADTWLVFDLEAADVGEVVAIGFDDDLLGSVFPLFQLGGAHTYANQTYRTYTEGDGKVRFEINVGAFYQGDFKYLTAIADDDGGQSADVTFSDIRIEERPALLVNGVGREVVSYGGAEDEGVFAVENAGARIALSDNAWKAAVVNAEINEATWIAFDFFSDAAPEIAGIGFDADLVADAAGFFQIAGSETYGNQDHRSYAIGDGWVRYEIHVGAALAAGTYENLVFVADDDAAPVGAAAFENIEIYDVLSAQMDVADGIRDVISLVAAEDAGTATQLPDGGVEMTGDAWKAIEVPGFFVGDSDRGRPYHAWLSFTVEVTAEAEVVAIGTARDENVAESRFWQLSGTDAWGNQDENDVAVGGGPVRKLIDLYSSGFGSSHNRVGFIVDDDDGGEGTAIFSAVDVLVNPWDTLWRDDGAGGAYMLLGGGLAMMEDSTTRYIAISAQVDANAILHFEFKTHDEGAVHGIGFGKVGDGNPSPGDTFWQIAGTETDGWQDANGLYEEGDGWMEFQIDVGGRSFGGSGSYFVITFVQEAAAPGDALDSFFRNVWIENAGAADTDFMVF